MNPVKKEKNTPSSAALHAILKRSSPIVAQEVAGSVAPPTQIPLIPHCKNTSLGGNVRSWNSKRTTATLVPRPNGIVPCRPEEKFAKRGIAIRWLAYRLDLEHEIVCRFTELYINQHNAMPDYNFYSRSGTIKTKQCDSRLMEQAKFTVALNRSRNPLKLTGKSQKIGFFYVGLGTIPRAKADELAWRFEKNYMKIRQKPLSYNPKQFHRVLVFPREDADVLRATINMAGLEHISLGPTETIV